MDAFREIIGCAVVKEELRRILDMLEYPDKYSAIGAEIPHGLLLYGPPGVGKTMIAEAFIRASGLKCVRLNRVGDNSVFLSMILSGFRQAAEAAAADGYSIIFMDDLDSFPDESDSMDEYAAVQSGIDSVRDEGVFVIAAANDISDMPDSLIRAGRFDMKYRLEIPYGKDAEEVILQHLKKYRLNAEVCKTDIVRLFTGISCAEISTVMNRAAVIAAYRGAAEIGTDHITEAALTGIFGALPEAVCPEIPGDAHDARRKRIAYHEAGHALISEVLAPGSVCLLSLRRREGCGDAGLMGVSPDPERRDIHALTALGGYAAELQVFGDTGRGSASDIEEAAKHISADIRKEGITGLGHVDIHRKYEEVSPEYLYSQELYISFMLNEKLQEACRIISENRAFLDRLAGKLTSRGSLLSSDIKECAGTGSRNCSIFNNCITT